MIDKLKLGIVYDEKGKIKNHRSLIKVTINPFLRLFGLQITTIYNPKEQKLYYPKIERTGRRRKLMFDYKLQEGWLIKKERILI